MKRPVTLSGGTGGKETETMSETALQFTPYAGAQTQSTDRTALRRLHRVLLTVLCVHLLIALASSWGIIRDDAESYTLIGRSLAHGNGFAFHVGPLTTAWRAPGYPVLLGIIFRLTGDSLTAVRIVQAFLWTLTAYLTYLVARRTLKPETALIAAGLAGLYPEIAGMSGILWSESLFVPLFLGAVYALFQNKDCPTWRLSVLCGVLIGSAILTRSTALVLIPLVWFVAWSGAKARGTYARAALISVLALCIMGAWTARNYLEFHTLIPVESNTGYNLYVGSRPDTPIPFAWRRAEKLPTDPLYLSLTEGRGEIERYTLLTHVSTAEMKAHPLRMLTLAFGKAFDFWLPDFFVSLNVKSGAFGAAYQKCWLPVLALTLSVSCVVFVAALRGIWHTRRTWETRAMVVLCALYTLPHTFVYGASRYHLPLLPLLFILAAPELQRWLTAKALTPRPSFPGLGEGQEQNVSGGKTA